MNLIVNVFKYNISNKLYQKDAASPLSNIYITLRNTDGTCISKRTSTDGSVTFSGLTSGQKYTVYETLQNISGNNTEAFFDNLVAKQPIIGDSNTNIYVAVTSTTPRKYKITATNDTVKTIEFGHSVYKPIRCHNKGYIVTVPQGSTKTTLYEVDIKSGNNRELFQYNEILNALAYNYKEGILYAMSLNDSWLGLYRINGVGDMVKVTSAIDNSTNETWIIPRMSIASADNNGNYYICYQAAKDVTNRGFYRINLNQESLNYLYVYKMGISGFGPATSDGTSSSYTIADWKYNNNTKKLYAFVDNKLVYPNQDPPEQINKIIEFTVNLSTNQYVGNLLLTDASTVIADYNSQTDPEQKTRARTMVGAYGYDDGLVFFMSGTGKIYKVDINNPGTKVIENFSTISPAPFNGDGANCSCACYRLDFGNAPESNIYLTAAYKTTLANNGPRHAVCPNIHIGKVVYPEEYAIIGQTADDNDGVEEPLQVLDQSTDKYFLDVECYNNTEYPAKLYAWLDFNTDGIFSVDEFVSADILPSDSYQTVSLEFTRLSYSITTLSRTFIRLRLTTEDLQTTATGKQEDTRSLSNVTAAIDGEVEDWLLNTGKVPYVICKKTSDKDVEDGILVQPGENITYTIEVKNYGGEPAKNIIIKDDFDILLSDVEFISAEYKKDTNVIIVDKQQLKDGVNIGSLQKNEKVVFTIVVKVK